MWNCLYISLHTVPDNWTTVSVTPSTRETIFNNTQYSLICTVSTISGLGNLPVMVEWVGPNGTAVGSEENRVLGDVATEGTMHTLTLTFDPIFHGDGGTYTCVASLSVDWEKGQPPQHSVPHHVPVISESRVIFFCNTMKPLLIEGRSSERGWSLWIMDTLGPAMLSFIREVVLFSEVQMY